MVRRKITLIGFGDMIKPENRSIAGFDESLNSMVQPDEIHTEYTNERHW